MRSIFSPSGEIGRGEGDDIAFAYAVGTGVRGQLSVFIPEDLRLQGRAGLFKIEIDRYFLAGGNEKDPEQGKEKEHPDDRIGEQGSFGAFFLDIHKQSSFAIDLHRLRRQA